MQYENSNFDRENSLSLPKTSETNPKKILYEFFQFYDGIDAILFDRCPMIGQPRWTSGMLKIGKTTDV